MSLASSGSDIFTNAQIIMIEANDRKLPVGIQSFEEIFGDKTIKLNLDSFTVWDNYAL